MASRTTKSITRRALEETGLVSLYRTPVDVKLLCLQRFTRLFAYGASTLVLVAYLRELGISKTRIGLFMTLTLVGDVCISFLLTLFADALGRKAILALGAVLMAGAGVVFATCGEYWALLAAAVVGVISPAGNEIGPFRAIEESVVAHLTPSESRSDVYAWYSLSGTAGVAFGMVVCGWVVHGLTVGQHWVLVDAYRVVFFGYALFGVLKLLLTIMLSPAVEADRKQKKPVIAPQARQEANGETAPLLGDGSGNAVANGNEDSEAHEEAQDDEEPKPKGKLRSLLPDISKESVGVLVGMSITFALDAFGSGLAPLSWVTFFFRSRYGLEEGKLGSIFFTTSIIASCSMIVASSLAKRFGNVNTMVFTHLPSSIFLALIPIPNDVHWSLLFLILRSCSQSMDVAPRSAFLAAIILPEERTAVMGFLNVVKTTASSLGPLITGVLADRSLFWVSFICAGSLKACYDIGMLVMFKNHEREKAERERMRAARRAADEETNAEQ